MPNGVVDLVVPDEAAGVQVAKQYLSYFQGPLTPRAEHINRCTDQRLLRDVIPENRKRIYAMKSVITLLADIDSVLYLREGYGVGMHTALVNCISSVWLPSVTDVNRCALPAAQSEL